MRKVFGQPFGRSTLPPGRSRRTFAPVKAHSRIADSAGPSATIQIDATSDDLTGVLVAADGRRHEFTGWIELAGAIEDWRQGEGPGDGHRQAASPS